MNYPANFHIPRLLVVADADDVARSRNTSKPVDAPIFLKRAAVYFVISFDDQPGFCHSAFFRQTLNVRNGRKADIEFNR